LTLLCRQAEATDAPVILGMLTALARHDAAQSDLDESAIRRYGFGPKPLFRVILAEDDGVPKGLILFYPDFSTLRGRPGTYVQDLYILPEARGTGIGRTLLARAEAMARASWGSTYTTLIVDRRNSQARAFYARLGFADRGDYDLLVRE
jgi:ribosomal protein S18 acetylase RimI-like enzyme